MKGLGRTKQQLERVQMVSGFYIITMCGELHFPGYFTAVCIDVYLILKGACSNGILHALSRSSERCIICVWSYPTYSNSFFFWDREALTFGARDGSKGPVPEHTTTSRPPWEESKIQLRIFFQETQRGDTSVAPLGRMFIWLCLIPNWARHIW